MPRIRLATGAEVATRLPLSIQATPATLGELASGDYTLSTAQATALGLPTQAAGALAIRWGTTGGAVRIARWEAVLGTTAYVWIAAWSSGQQSYGTWRQV